MKNEQEIKEKIANLQHHRNKYMNYDRTMKEPKEVLLYDFAISQLEWVIE